MMKLSSQRGDTIVETLCSLMIFLVILGAFTAVMVEISGLNKEIETSENSTPVVSSWDVNDVTITDLSVNVTYSYPAHDNGDESEND